ncbi:toprim domain-containing protein [Sphingomonas sp. IC081]|uniref:DUF7146 domain-containing protein n=1 Tax=Sphingomonas sp. IC081 TaxID=304378 RepID=UPI0021AE5AFB|nr:toprim domain-containing protein [Sphingomonas sp. IC081]
MATTPQSAARQIVRDLKGTWHGRYGKVCCPAHDDRHASLSITPGRKAVLFHCFAGCTQNEIIGALRAQRLNPTITAPADAPAKPTNDMTSLCRHLWDLALPTQGTPAAHYLAKRGLSHSTAGRYAPGAITYEAGRKLRLPALLLPMTQSGRLVALLRVFLETDGRKCACLDAAKRTLGDPRQSAVHLGAPADDTMNLAEGFEDAESAIVLNELSGCSAVCGVERYRDLYIPDHVRRVRVYSQHGKAARDGLVRAHPHLTANGRSLQIILPPPGGDWNDALLAKRRAKQ